MVENVHFYIPREDWPAGMPSRVEDYWEWARRDKRYRLGSYNWTILTYLHLSRAGVPCSIGTSMPDDALVISHRDFLPRWPSIRRFFVSMQADRPRHPFAQIHLVQNPAAVRDIGAELSPLHACDYYLPYWPQPGLVPRRPDRGDVFENIAFFGNRRQLAAELYDDAWERTLRAEGLNWLVVDPVSWNDFSEIDAIVAVRSFSHRGRFRSKPATKLTNAWLAGVPAILGRESAYEHERRSDLDYIEVASREEALAAVVRLRDDPSLRAAMVDNGRARSKERDPARIMELWRLFLDTVAFPQLARWLDWPHRRRRAFLLSQGVGGVRMLRSKGAFWD